LSSIREQVLLTTKTALGSAGTPAATVTRSQLDQIKQESLPCYDITPGEEKVEDPGEYGDHESVTRTLPVTVRAIVDAGAAEGEDSDPTIDLDDSALDPFYVFAVQQLLGDASPLGALVNDVREMSGTTVFRPEGRAIIGLEIQFEYIFATKRGDPTQKG